MQIKNFILVEKLQKSGFSDKEAKIYVSTLELGGGYPSKIAEYSGLNRSTAYQVLLNLSVRGLVNEIEKKNKIFYQVERPEKIISFAKGKIRTAEESLEKLKSTLPEIEGLYGALGTRPKITYYEGEEGLLAIYQDHIDIEKSYEMLAWANADELRNFLPEKFFDHYVHEKEKVGISTRGIIPDTVENKNFNEVRYANIEKKYWPKMRFLKAELFPLKGEITIYGERKVSIVNFQKETLIGVIIEDEAIHKAMESIFELSWTSSMLAK